MSLAGTAPAPPPTGPDVEVNGGDRSCTQLLRELHAHTRHLSPGTVVRLYACDAIAPIDLAAWCHLAGHHYAGPAPADPRRGAGQRLAGSASGCPGYDIVLGCR